MTDYAAMSDAELNRAIAERLGYTVRRISEPREMSFREGLHEYLLIGPHGFSVYGAEEGAIGSETGAWGQLPRWSNDVGAAMSLIDAIPYQLTHVLWSDTFKYIVSVDRDEYSQFVVKGLSLPRCLSECWLTWKEATG